MQKKAVVSVMKNDLSFVFSGFYSTLLPEAGCLCITGQQTQTGRGQEPSWDFHPSEDLSEPPSLRDPAFHGAVTGRKYHCRLFRSRQTVHRRLLWNGYFPLCAFDMIVLTGIFHLQAVPAYPSGAFPFGLNS